MCASILPLGKGSSNEEVGTYHVHKEGQGPALHGIQLFATRAGRQSCGSCLVPCRHLRPVFSRFHHRRRALWIPSPLQSRRPASCSASPLDLPVLPGHVGRRPGARISSRWPSGVDYFAFTNEGAPPCWWASTLKLSLLAATSRQAKAPKLVWLFTTQTKHLDQGEALGTEGRTRTVLTSDFKTVLAGAARAHSTPASRTVQRPWNAVHVSHPSPFHSILE